MKLSKCIESLKGCKYECEAGPLENNVDFIYLVKVAKKLEECMNTGNCDAYRCYECGFANECSEMWELANND